MILDLVYLVVLFVASPWLVWRSVRTGRYRQHLAGKLLGRVAIAPDSRPTVWFHGVSVGEIHLLATVVAAFKQRFPGYRVVVSSTTDTGLSEAVARFPTDPVIPWPFDFSWATATALDRVKPTLLVLAEAEMWPNFLAAARRRRVPVVVVNARLSPRSFGRYRRIGGLARRLLLRHVSIIAAQSAETAERFVALGAANVRVTGSVKYDGAVGDRDTPKGRELRRVLGSDLTPQPPLRSGEGGPESSSPLSASERGAGGVRLILVAGSTHAPEEEIVLAAFAKLRDRFPTLRLILVPRHPDRFDAVAKLLETSGLPFARRSLLREPTDVPVLLLDTVGELGAAWGLADVGYVGGTLDGHRGGQSMIEPAGYGVPTVFGPHVWNFRDAVRSLLDAGGAEMVKEATELEPALARLLADEERRREMGAAARELVRRQQGATARTLDVLGELLPTPAARAA